MEWELWRRWELYGIRLCWKWKELDKKLKETRIKWVEKEAKRVLFEDCRTNRKKGKKTAIEEKKEQNETTKIRKKEWKTYEEETSVGKMATEESHWCNSQGNYSNQTWLFLECVDSCY